jgi:hypothetical protein
MFLHDNTPVPVYHDQPGRYVTVNSSLKILCFGYYRQDGGMFNNLSYVRGIYGFPYRMESGVTITGVDQNGTIQMSYNNESINLGHGETWESPIISSRIATFSSYPGNATLEFNMSWWIYNEKESYKV